MYNPSIYEFLKLTKNNNVIPVFCEINADLDTPVSAYLKIKKNDYAFLLESVEGQENIARYSFLGSNPALIFKSKGRIVEIIRSGGKTKRIILKSGDPLDELKKIMRDFKAAPVKGLPRFCGGLVGYIGYDFVRFLEKLPDKNKDDLFLCDFCFILTDTLLVFDHVNHTIKIICNVILPETNFKLSKKAKVRIYKKAVLKIEAIRKDLIKPAAALKTKFVRAQEKLTIDSNFTKSAFCHIVNKAKRYIRNGDIIQAVLSQRFKFKIKKDPFDIYRNLRSLNPSPYMFFLKLKEAVLVGSSPEMLVRCEEGQVETRPIAGTRKRGRNEFEDNRLKTELLNDQKERAEHLMLVDLGRNDLGRVSKPGTVKVNEFMGVEKYSHVMHLVSDVSGQLKNGLDAYDTLRACFPAGTVTGSPKVRAMEIIDELENLRRGPYAGCVGYFSFSHNMDTCITIRTIVMKKNTAYIQAGAGIVLDSVAEKEYAESVNKAKALIVAITK